MADPQGLGESYGLVTTNDGTQYQVPAGLSQKQAFDLVSTIDPVRMGSSGHFSNLGDTFDFRTGVNDASLRIRLALASTMEEKAFILNDMAGPNNWGFTDWSNEPFVTPGGYQNINGTPAPSDRLFLVDPAGSSSVGSFGGDLIDLAPGGAVFAGAVVGEALMPLPGTGVVGAGIVRGVLGNIVRRALGAGAGTLGVNAGLDIAQWGIGDNRESLGEVLKREGTEAGLVFGATLALGAPLAALAPAARGIGAKATSMGIGLQAPAKSTARATQLGRVTAAQQRVAETLGDDITLPVNIRTLAGDVDTGQLGFLSKQAATLESAAIKASGGDSVLSAKAANMLQKAKQLMQGRVPDKISGKEIKANFSAKELKALKQLALATENKGSVAYKTKELAKLDKVDRTARALRTNMTTNLKSVHQATLKEYEPKFAAFKQSAANKGINDNDMATMLNTIARELTEADIGLTTFQAADKLLNMLPNGPARLRIVDSDIALKPTKGKGKIPAGTSSFTADDLLSMDHTLRSQNFRNAGSGAKNFAEARRNGKASALLHENMRNKKLYNDKDWVNLSKGYSADVTPFYGRGKSRGLFKVFDDSSGTNLETLIKGIVDGKEALELSKFFAHVNKVFGVSNTKAAKEGIPTADEIFGHMGEALIREKSVELGTLARLATTKTTDLKKAANKIQNDLTALEVSVAKKFGTQKAAKAAWHKLFNKGQNGIVGKFRRDLAKIAGNNPASAMSAAQSLSTIPTRQEVGKLLNTIANAADDPKKLGAIDTEIQDSFFSVYSRIKKTDPESAKFLSDTYNAEVFSRLTALAGEGKTGYGLMKKWSDDFSSAVADPEIDGMLKSLLGKQAYQDYTDLALTLKGGLDFDPSAGSIVLGAMPMVIMGNLIQGNLKGMSKPALMMMTIKNFAPGTPLWKKMQAPLAAARSPQATKNAIDTTTSKAGKAFNGALTKAQWLSNRVANGQAGYLAAGIHAFLDENYYEASTKPQQIPTPVPTTPEEEQQQVAAPPVVPSPAPPAPSPVTGLGQAGLNIGTNIAQGVTR